MPVFDEAGGSLTTNLGDVEVFCAGRPGSGAMADGNRAHRMVASEVSVADRNVI